MGSESSYKNESYTVSNQGLDSVKNEIKHNHPSHNIKLYECDYLYASVGLHRKLEFEFHCSDCNYVCYVLMDKTENGNKNIRINYSTGYSKKWWIWTYRPDKYISCGRCFDLFEDAPSGYNKLTNNCSHFAKYIWDRL